MGMGWTPMPGRCNEISPLKEWRCNRSRGHEGDHKAIDPSAPTSAPMNGCLIEGWDDGREREFWPVVARVVDGQAAMFDA